MNDRGPAAIPPPEPDEPAVSAAARRTMQANRGRDTRPELALRSLLHASGLRFRVSDPLPFARRRRADLTFTRVRLVIFVDGCFWHGCPEHFVVPKTRTAFWLAKITKNQARDADTVEMLEADGYVVLRFWEHEEPQRAAAIIEQTYWHLRGLQASVTPNPI